jgi:hypothetical protein
MKQVYYLLSTTLCSFFIIIYLNSCRKSENLQPIIICDICKTQNKQESYTTIVVTDSNWVTVYPGYYTSDLRVVLKKNNDTLDHILYVYLADSAFGQLISLSQTIIYKSGQLSLLGDQLVFKAEYKQIPFRSIDLRITAY